MSIPGYFTDILKKESVRLPNVTFRGLYVLSNTTTARFIRSC